MASVDSGDQHKLAFANDAESGEQQLQQQFACKSLLCSDALLQYILETSVYPREPEPLRELREMTASHPLNVMSVPPDEGQFLMMLVKLTNAKNTIELGVYTGYSLLSTALALPEDGKIIAIDIHRSYYELGVPFMQKAGVHHKIDFREGQGLTVLEELMQDDQNLGFFDFVFVDADKINYLNYHERIIQLVKVGGLIGYDNTLWSGSLIAPDDTPFPDYVKHRKPYVLQMNKTLATDPRIEICMLTIADGITLCRRVC